MVGEFHFMMQIQPINTGILFDQRLFFLFFFSEEKPLILHVQLLSWKRYA